MNAYHFIRHVASGWDNILNNVMSDDIFSLVHDIGMHSIAYITFILTILDTDSPRFRYFRYLSFQRGSKIERTKKNFLINLILRAALMGLLDYGVNTGK